MTQLLEQISTATGKPYFPEAVDLGVFTAIDQLPWSTDEQVEKWLLLIGDAPPYDPSFVEPETKAQRWYDTDFLVDLANKKNLKIHCLLCSSREIEKMAYEDSLDKTRRFMSRLADGTGGQMLDLSYPFVRDRLVENAAARKAQYSRIGYITQAEIDAIARQHQAVETGNQQIIRIAVLPFLPLESMAFLYEKPEVQMATELRQRLQVLPNVRTVSPRQVEEEILRLQREGGPVKDWPQALNIRLRTDYVLHGSMRLAESAFVETSVFGRDNPEPLIQLATSGALEQQAGALLSNLKQTRQRPEALQPLLQRLETIEESADGTSGSIAMLQNLSSEERSHLLGAFEALEQSLGYALGDELGEELLNKAEMELQQLLTTQPEHAFAHALRASCLYNQANLQEGRGRLEEAKALMAQSNDAIKEAYRLRSQIVDRLARLEVEADYALLVAKDYPAAISAYEQIVSFSEASPIQSALRAHWMLAGIYNGAWDIAKHDASVANPDKAKHHIVQILAFWPESVEATSIKRYLLWDDQNNKSRTPYLPIEGDLLTSNE
jgi:tetratricopeptide (TPR) repeat protein